MKVTQPVIILAAIVALCLVIGPAAAVASEKEPQKVTVAADTKAWVPVGRTTEKIVLVEQDVMRYQKNSWKLEFYRNKAYKCGLSGYYTFLVVEPRNAPGKKAPLWVYLHGGAVGYYDDNGVYRTKKGQTKDTWNHESSLAVLRKINPNHPIIKQGRAVDNTITRRLKEGYRVLVVSYGDHDLYSGVGTPYPNNPKGGEVNGLQACMAAVEYTAMNYPTTHVFTHGTSAGSFGAYALGFAFDQEGIKLSGLVMDSGLATPRKIKILDAFAGKPGFPQSKEFKVEGVVKKIGVMVDPKLPFYPEAAVRAGFDVPMLVVAGKKDPFSAGNFPPIAEAKEAGLCNYYWALDGLRQAIEQQKDSPHQILKLDDWGHVPTNRDGCPANDVVDAFIRKAVSSRTSYPFEKISMSRSVSEL